MFVLIVFYKNRRLGKEEWRIKENFVGYKLVLYILIWLLIYIYYVFVELF